MNELYVRLLTGLILGVGILTFFFLPHFLFVILTILVLIRIVGWEWPRLFALDDPYFWIILPFYPIVPLLLFLYMQLQGYEELNLLLITVVAGHDAGSYLVGKPFGRQLISPTISPHKTWEGFAGGVLLSFALSLMFFWQNPLALWLGSVLPFVVSINFAALAGDLFESMLKRQANIKDSGTLLPGHGGILDRIDGLLFAIVIAFLARNWLACLVG